MKHAARDPGPARGGWRRALSRGLAGLGAALLLAAPAGGTPPVGLGNAREYQVKAAFLYKFAKFVTWPEGTLGASDAPFALCILGRDPFGGALDRTVEGRRVGRRPIEVQRAQSLEKVDGCHVLFISGSEQGRLASILAKLAGRPVLTVADMEGFARRGGMINLVIEERKIRLEINPGVARKASLKIDSELLSLATVVESDAP